jgi:hypothetical protein
MVANIKSKEIQVQKPAQSLQAFQAKFASGEDAQSGVLKMALIAAGSLVVIAVLGFGFASWRTRTVEKHESALADLLLEVQGDGQTPVPPPEMEKRMRERLPRLEALAAKAPSSSRSVTQGILNAWRLDLDGKAQAAATPSDAWGKLRVAQRQIALGQGAEALANLTPMRKAAVPSEAWATLYWSTLLDARRLQGDREAAWKDLAEYKSRFRKRPIPPRWSV